MKSRKIFLIAVVCLILGLITTVLQAQPVVNGPSDEDFGAAANLVAIGVSGSDRAFLNQKVSVTYTVQNQGDAASGAYAVRLYLSKNTTISADSDRLLRSVSFATGLAPGASRTTSSEVRIPINGLTGKYYFGAVVASSSLASSWKVSIVRYAAHSNGTVTDHKTGLVWQRSDDGQTRTWNAAGNYCKNMELGGKTDWRLPSIYELQTIVDYSKNWPSINAVFECRSERYWADTIGDSNPFNAWLINFTEGFVDWYSKSVSYYVRCVRGEPW